MPDKMTAMAWPGRAASATLASSVSPPTSWRLVAGHRETWRPVRVAKVLPGMTVMPGPHVDRPGIAERIGRLVRFCSSAARVSCSLCGRCHTTSTGTAPARGMCEEAR